MHSDRISKAQKIKADLCPVLDAAGTLVIASAGRHGLIESVRGSRRATRGCRSWWRVPSGCHSGCSWCWCAAGNFLRATLASWLLPCTRALSSPPSLSRTGCCHTPVRPRLTGQPRRSSGVCGCRNPGIWKGLCCRPTMTRLAWHQLQCPRNAECLPWSLNVVTPAT